MKLEGQGEDFLQGNSKQDAVLVDGDFQVYDEDPEKLPRPASSSHYSS